MTNEQENKNKWRVQYLAGVVLDEVTVLADWAGVDPDSGALTFTKRGEDVNAQSVMVAMYAPGAWVRVERV